MMLFYTRVQDNPGRPRNFAERDDERDLVRAITTLRNTHGFSFAAGKIKK